VNTSHLRCDGANQVAISHKRVKIKQINFPQKLNIERHLNISKYLERARVIKSLENYSTPHSMKSKMCEKLAFCALAIESEVFIIL
jgi:hypothetical protein